MFTAGESLLARLLPVGEEWIFSGGVCPSGQRQAEELAGLFEMASPADLVLDLLAMTDEFLADEDEDADVDFDLEGDD